MEQGRSGRHGHSNRGSYGRLAGAIRRMKNDKRLPAPTEATYGRAAASCAGKWSGSRKHDRLIEQVAILEARIEQMPARTWTPKITLVNAPTPSKETRSMEELGTDNLPDCMSTSSDLGPAPPAPAAARGK